MSTQTNNQMISIAWHCFWVFFSWLIVGSIGLAQMPDVSFEVRYFEGLRIGPRRFEVEITFLDPKLVSTIEQTYFLHLRNSYADQSCVTTPIVFSAGAKSTTIQLELNSPDQYFYNPQFVLTRGSSPNSSTIARSFLSGLFESPNHSLEKSYLFVWEKPPFRTSVSTADLVYSSASGMRGGRMAVPTFSFVNKGAQSATRMPTLAHLSDFVITSNAKSQMSSVFNSMSADHRMLAMAGLNTANFEDLPEHWPTLTMADVLFIPAADLVSLASQNPQKARAIRDRVASGGQLVVYDCGPNVARRNEIMPALNAASNSSDQAPEKWTAWQLTNVDHQELQQERSKQLGMIDTQLAQLQTNLVQSASLRWSGSPYDSALQAIEKLRTERQELLNKSYSSKKSENADAECFALELGKGSVVAITGDLADFAKADWLSLTLFLDQMPKESFSDLVGIEQSSHSVRGVGEPPKILFLFLVSAFAIFVGPVCFLVLRRNRRQNWILLLVPAVSLLSTLLLLAYGILIDGFDYRVNQVSSTFLDSRNKCAVIQSHNAVFAGRTPQPLQVDANSVLDIGVEDNGYYNNRNSAPSYLNVNEFGSTYSGGRSRARTKHRVSVISVKEIDASFTIRAVASDSGAIPKVMAENALGIEVELIMAKKDGVLYWGENIQPEGVAELTKSDPTVTQDQLKQKLQGIREEIDRECFSDDFFPRTAVANTWSPGVRAMGSFDMPGQTWDQRDLLAGDFSSLDNGEFWLITRSNPWVEDLNPNPTYQYRIHFIYGKW